MHALLLIIGSLIGVNCAACNLANASQKDSNTECPKGSVYICNVPMYALYGDLHEYIDRNVSVAGFIVRLGNDYLLFPEKGIAQYVVSEQALLLVDEGNKYEAHLKDSEQAYVRVVGRVMKPGDSRFWASLRLAKPPQPLPFVSEKNRGKSRDLYDPPTSRPVRP